LFRKLLSKVPLQIPLSAISEVKIGIWHAGKWLAGRPIVKVDWQNEEGLLLTSGLGLGNHELAQGLVGELRRKTGDIKRST
jgi:hypothetical protein